jgi:hypothetical protein
VVNVSDYYIKLRSISDEEEEFELAGDNIAQIDVMDISGSNITKDCRVQITLSKNALLGLGTELIRLAHKFSDGRHFHIDPISQDSAVQTLGIMHHPGSCELIVGCGEFKSFDKFINDGK